MTYVVRMTVLGGAVGTVGGQGPRTMRQVLSQLDRSFWSPPPEPSQCGPEFSDW